MNLKLARLPIPPHPRVDSNDETRWEYSSRLRGTGYHATH